MFDISVLRYPADLIDNPERLMRDVGIVSMGINPSAPRLHMGHYLTLFQFSKALLNNPNAKGICYVDDREFDFQKRLHEMEHLFAGSLACHANSVRQRIVETLAYFGESEGDSSFPRRVEVPKMSAWCKSVSEQAQSNNGGQLYKMIYDHRQLIASSFIPTDHWDTSDIALVQPLCPDCFTGQRYTNEIHLVRNAIAGVCRNKFCNSNGKDFVVSPEARTGDWTILYTIDPIRDALLSLSKKTKVLHIFGGDYGLPWGDTGKSKAARLAKLIPQLAQGSKVDHYVGPMLMRNGKKLSKSNGDFLSEPPQIEDLERLLLQGSEHISV